MRIFMTGASGWIGSAATRQLLATGHRVVGLARSEESAARLTALGAEVHRGSIDDPASLRAGAESTDGVVHLAYNHDFSRMADAARTDRAAIDAFGAALRGSDRPLIIASGTLGLAPGRVATERDQAEAATHPRIANADATLALAESGVRSVVVRFAPTVHGAGDHGFISVLVGIARDKGVSGYVGDGQNRWPAVHRDDAAELVRLAVEQAPAGSVLHATGEEGITGQAIAEAIGAGLNLPATSIPAEQAEQHFGWIGGFFGFDCPASSTLTQQQLGWTPTGPGLIEDLRQGHYFS